MIKQSRNNLTPPNADITIMIQASYISHTLIYDDIKFGHLLAEPKLRADGEKHLNTRAASDRWVMTNTTS
jgi:hypothetical protein